MKTSLRFKPVILSISAVILLGTIGLTIMNISAVYAQEQEVKEVQAGIGVANAAITLFSPQQVQIKTGQSITWYNPTPVPEPHTVTFVLKNNNGNDNKSYAADLIAPFTISSITTTNSTQIMPVIPNSNSEPLMTPDNNAIIAINKRAYNPVVVIEDSTTTVGNNVTYMKQNTNYSMSGTEDYVNSGWLLPKGQENVYPGSGNTFTMTFQKAGTYDYLCIIHPYMTGRVIVK
ncbi:MAG TPA: plastocyanin/azurin family copper-binding protein [Nitrososphaeraceae archaeon]|nr:plastocyanin/azurin family copper-binding protein [Nitrososphaeraceae archaeon]